MLRSVFLRATMMALLLLTRPSGTQAQEPLYTVTLPDKQKLYLGVRLSTLPDGSKSGRLYSRQTGGLAANLQAESEIAANVEGQTTRCRLFWGPMGSVGVMLEAVRADLHGNGEGYNIQVPGLRETLPFTGKLLSNLSMELFLGRQYDWARGGTQTFSYLVDYATPLPKLYTIKLTADGSEEIMLETGKVKARKLKFEAALPFLPKEQQTGIFYVGPSGELLRSDTAFLGGPYTAKGPATWDADSRTLTVESTALQSLAATARIYPKRCVMEAGIKNSVQFVKGETDSSFSLLRQESPWLGRPLVVTVTNNALRYTLEPTSPVLTLVPSSRAFFLPHWFLTELWEKSPGLWTDLPVGEKREGDYFPLFTGVTDSIPCTLERRADVSVVYGNQNVVLHRYGFTSPVNYEIYTDGARLVAAFGSDGTLFQRDGWESAVRTLPRPEPPKPVK